MTYLKYFKSEAAAKAYNHYIYLSNLKPDVTSNRCDFPIIKHPTQDKWALKITDPNKLKGLDLVMKLEVVSDAYLMEEGWFKLANVS
ncbi:MAG: hypothetical protein CMO01_17105 [Thalassobius sp.]|nr:hypothetical protein [Thalassovita sp.]